MSPVVIVDCHEPSLTRYECDENGNKRRTHAAVGDAPCLFDAGEVERFRTHPEGRFYVGPPAQPPGPLNTPGAPAVAGSGMTRSATHRQADIARSLRAAAKAPGQWQVELSPSGSIFILPATDRPKTQKRLPPPVAHA